MPTTPTPPVTRTSRPTQTPAGSPRQGADPLHTVHPRPRARGVLRPDRALPGAVVALTIWSLAGSALAVASGLSASWADAVGPTGRLSVPLPMNAALLLLALAAGSTRRRAALPAAVLLSLACGAAVVSGLFDGGYAAALTPLARVAQVVLVLGLTAVAALAGRRAWRVRRG